MLRKATLVWILVTLPITAIAMYNDVLLKGLDTNKPVVLVVNEVERPLGSVGPGGDISIPLNADVDAALDPNKNYSVYKDSCNRYVIFIKDSDDEKRCREKNQKAESDNPCGRCVPVAWILKGQVSAHPDAPSTPASVATAGGGPSVDVFFLGGWNRTSFPEIDQAKGTIADRYTAGPAPYNQFDTTVDRRDNGFGAGAGVRVMFGNIGFLGAYSYQDLGGGEVHTAGTRVLNNLAFSLDSEFSIETHKIIVGVPIGTSRFQVIPYYGRAFWSLDRTIVDNLRAGNVQVRGGTTTFAADGSDHMFGARGEAYLNRWLGLFVDYERINFRNVFEPDGPDALPVHLDNTNINGGVVIRWWTLR